MLAQKRKRHEIRRQRRKALARVRSDHVRMRRPTVVNDINEPGHSESGFSRPSHLRQRAETAVFQEVLSDSVETDAVIRGTAGHPFYVRGRGWVHLCDLRPGDRLRTHEGRWVTVTQVRDTGREEPVYNLCVGNRHTYYVGSGSGDLSVLVHNSSNAGPTTQPTTQPAQITNTQSWTSTGTNTNTTQVAYTYTSPFSGLSFAGLGSYAEAGTKKSDTNTFTAELRDKYEGTTLDFQYIYGDAITLGKDGTSNSFQHSGSIYGSQDISLGAFTLDLKGTAKDSFDKNSITVSEAATVQLSKPWQMFPDFPLTASLSSQFTDSQVINAAAGARNSYYSIGASAMFNYAINPNASITFGITEAYSNNGGLPGTGGPQNVLTYSLGAQFKF